MHNSTLQRYSITRPYKCNNWHNVWKNLQAVSLGKTNNLRPVIALAVSFWTNKRIVSFACKLLSAQCGTVNARWDFFDPSTTPRADLGGRSVAWQTDSVVGFVEPVRLVEPIGSDRCLDGIRSFWWRERAVSWCMWEWRMRLVLSFTEGKGPVYFFCPSME